MRCSQNPHACVLSHFSRVCLCVTLWAIACQAPLTKGFSRQENWSRFPCLPPGDLPDAGIEPESLYVSFIGRLVLYHWYHLETLQNLWRQMYCCYSVPKSGPTLCNPWTAACQVSLSFTISLSLLRLMSIESVIPSNHFIVCHHLLLLPSVFPCIRSFPKSWVFESGGQGIGASALTLVLPMNIQCWFLLGLIHLISFLSKGLSRVFSSTTVWSISSSVLSLLYGPTLTPRHNYRKNHSFDSTDLCWQSDVSAFQYAF